MSRFSAASLCLYSTTHSADAVAAVLGLDPVSAHEKGDRRLGKQGREYAPYATSVWIYEPDKSAIDPNDDSGFAALRALLLDVRGCADALASLRPEYETVIRWSGDVSNQGNFAIEADMIVDLGRLGCEFYGTAYPEEDDPDSSGS